MWVRLRWRLYAGTSRRIIGSQGVLEEQYPRGFNKPPWSIQPFDAPDKREKPNLGPDAARSNTNPLVYDFRLQPDLTFHLTLVPVL